MQILESIGLSILPSWEILWQKFLFIVYLFALFIFYSSWNFDDRNVSVFVTVLQVPVALFFSFLCFLFILSKFYSPGFNFTILSSVQFTLLLNSLSEI